MSPRPARSRTCVVCLLAFLFAAPSAFAQEESIIGVAQAFSVWPPIEQAGPADTIPVAQTFTPAKRPSSLIPMYVSFATLQALDIHSTMSALSQGGRETNPIVGTAVRSPVALIAMKAGASAGLVFVSERLAKRHPRAAVIVMAAVNSAYAAIVAHNYSVARAR